MVNNVAFKAYDASTINSQINEVKRRSFFNSDSKIQTVDTVNKADSSSEIFNIIPNFLKFKASVLGWGAGIFNATLSSLAAGAAILGIASVSRKYYSGNSFVKASTQALKSLPKVAFNTLKDIHKQEGIIKTAANTITKPFKAFWKTSVGDIVKGLFVGLPKGTFNYIKNSKAGNIGKTIAVLTGASLYAYNMFQAFLNVNEKHAEIDHQFKVGHNG